MKPLKEQIPLEPVNIVAVRVLTSKGTKQSRLKPMTPSMFHSDFPPKLKTPSQTKKDSAYTGDLTGLKVGRLTVVGMVDLDQQDLPKKVARWAVRCACGRFEMRRHKSIKNPKNSDDCCVSCRVLQYAKSQYNRRIMHLRRESRS